MLVRFRNWLDHRTGYRKLFQALLIEHIPGGAKWRYVWGSCLAFVFLIQLITGVLLMTAYSPGDSTAWGSVYFIQYQMDFGWFIRGLHHFGSQTMVVLLCIHMLQVVIAGAHLPPREVNWWLGLLLMAVVLGLSLTGYLLPWDQKGYYATQVATNILGNVPLVGSFLQKVVVGGPEYGNATLTRFYALHVGILPPLLIVLVIAHLAVFRRHGVTTPPYAKGDGWFWPTQAFRDMVVSMIIFGVLVGMVVWGNQGNAVDMPDRNDGLYEVLAHGGVDGRGANLDAPADPQTPSYPARPEWYFLFLFQLLTYFEGALVLVGTVVIPTAVGILLFILPLLGHGRMRKFGHGFGVVVVVGILTGAVALTYLALAADQKDAVTTWLLTRIGTLLVPLSGLVLLLTLGVMSLLGQGMLRRIVGGFGTLVFALVVLAGAALTYLIFIDQTPEPVTRLAKERMMPEDRKPSDKGVSFQADRAKADQAAERAIALAGQGIPEEGGRYLLRRDPMTQGPELFGQHCASCHTHGTLFENKNPTASDLEDFGSKKWILGLLAAPDSPHYFGHTRFKGTTMSEWVRKTRGAASKVPERIKKLDEDFDRIATWLAGHPRKKIPSKGDRSDFARGYQAFESRCIRCHTYNGQKGDDSEDKGPDFTGYGDAEWLRQMIVSPDSPGRYGRAYRNAMPLFRNLEGPEGDITHHDLVRLKNMLVLEARTEVAKKKNKNVDDIEDTDPDFKKKHEQIDRALKVIHLSDVDRELIIRWLVKDDRVVFGGKPVTGAPPPNSPER